MGCWIDGFRMLHLYYSSVWFVAECYSAAAADDDDDDDGDGDGDGQVI